VSTKQERSCSGRKLLNLRAFSGEKGFLPFLEGKSANVKGTFDTALKRKKTAGEKA